MADIVHYRLERMFPELEDLEKRGLFTRQEIAEIVKTRRKFEYRLKRPSPLKQDLVKYIEYEKQLDRLRRLRKKSISVSAGKERVKKSKSSASDVAGVRRVIEIYRMATKRFKGDIQLWFQYLEFCKEKKNGRMKTALAEVMRFHPKVPAVWIYAAAWEYDNNLNFESALSLMQSGIRACPDSEDLWVECVRLILTHLNKLRTRKAMLGEDNSAQVGDIKLNEEKKWHDENGDLFMSLDGENGAANEPESQARDNKWDMLWVNVLQETYREAVKAIPSSFSLRNRFLEIVEATDLGHLEVVRTEILDGMKKDFSEEPDYWDWLAALKLTDRTAPDISSVDGRLLVDEVIEVYEEATSILRSAGMFEKYFKFLMNSINLSGEDEQDAGFSGVLDHTTEYISRLDSVFRKAEASGVLNEDLVCQYIKFYLNRGKTDKALEVADVFCDGRISDAKQLWVLRVTEQMRCTKESGAVSKAALSAIFQLFQKMAKNVAVCDVENLWVMALDLFANSKKYLRKFLEFSLILLAKDGGTDDGFSLPATLVKFVCQKNGIQQARELYKRLITWPHPGLGLYKHCIELEISAGDEASIANARKLFECALATYSENISLWQEYYVMEMKMGTSATANAVYWRAKKTLGDVSALSASSFA